MINQMKAPEARSLGKYPFGKIEMGFMRERDGRIFLLAAHGECTVKWPVLEDGSVLNQGEAEEPGVMVEMVDPKDIGITELKWTQPAQARA